MDDLLTALGVVLVFCAAAYFALPRATLTQAEKRLLFAKLVGTFMALHLAALTLGGINPVITALATYAIGRWVFVKAHPG